MGNKFAYPCASIDKWCSRVKISANNNRRKRSFLVFIIPSQHPKKVDIHQKSVPIPKKRFYECDYNIKCILYSCVLLDEAIMIIFKEKKQSKLEWIYIF